MPNWKAMTATGAAIGAIVGAVAAVDGRYARAGDVEALTRSIAAQAGGLSRQIELNRLNSDAGVLELRRATILDKLQDAAARGHPTAADVAIRQRYEADLKYVEAQLRDLRRQIESLRTAP